MSAGSSPEPSSPATTTAVAPLSIGEVVTLLRPEFSDLTDSKIRFLEERELISPARTSAGYRSFSPHDIEVLRWILTRQRDQYLPLSIIGERIERGEHLAEIWGIGVAGPQEPPGGTAETEQQDEPTFAAAADPSEWSVTDGSASYNAAELSARSGLSVDEIAELTDFGLLVTLADDDPARSLPPMTGSAQPDAVQSSLGLEPAEPRYGDSALVISRICREFANYGLGARHLRVIRNAATRDATLFEQGIQPIRLAGGASAELDARRAAGRLIALCERLRSVVMTEAMGLHSR